MYYKRVVCTGAHRHREIMEEMLDVHGKKLSKEGLGAMGKTRVVWGEFDSCMRTGCQTSSESLTVPFVKQVEEKLAFAISDLIDKGNAYSVDDGVYFSVESAPEKYGKLTGQNIDAVRGGAGGRVEGTGSSKRDHKDFALWKAAKPGEPTWDSPWGPGSRGLAGPGSYGRADLWAWGLRAHGPGLLGPWAWTHGPTEPGAHRPRISAGS